MGYGSSAWRSCVTWARTAGRPPRMLQARRSIPPQPEVALRAALLVLSPALLSRREESRECGVSLPKGYEMRNARERVAARKRVLLRPKLRSVSRLSAECGR